MHGPDRTRNVSTTRHYNGKTETVKKWRNVGSLVGFVTLFGITVRNGITMVSHWQHLHEIDGMSWGPELVFRGARERLAPVLMTALVTGLGLLPIAAGSGAAGREIQGPMAFVILGGLVTSTAINLLVLPLLYRRPRQVVGLLVLTGVALFIMPVFYRAFNI
jgi:Cu/Ag efflux pump CusA